MNNKQIAGLFILSVFLSILILACVDATVNSINYPYDNDVLSYSSRIPLDVTTTGATSCVFYYQTGYGIVAHNQTIGCNSETLVDLPNADGNYTLYVADDTGSSANINIQVQRDRGILATGFYIIFLLILMGIITNLITTIARMISFSYTPLETGISFGLYFAVLFSNWASIEYIRIPLITDFTNNFVAWLAFPLIVLPVLALILSIIFGEGKKIEKDLRRQNIHY